MGKKLFLFSLMFFQVSSLNPFSTLFKKFYLTWEDPYLILTSIQTFFWCKWNIRLHLLSENILSFWFLRKNFRLSQSSSSKKCFWYLRFVLKRKQLRSRENETQVKTNIFVENNKNNVLAFSNLSKMFDLF